MRILPIRTFNNNLNFKNTEKGWKPLIKFTVNVLTCYLIAYGVAKPIVSYFLQTQSKSIQENGAMFVGMCLFVGLNYIGQRFFAFKQKDDSY